MKRKIISIFCALTTAFFCVALTACGGGTSSSSANPRKDAGNWWTTDGVLKKNGGEIEFNDVNVKLTTVVTGEDRGTLSELIGEFNLIYREKINIIPDYIGQDVFETAVADRINLNNNAPDLIMSHQKGHKSFADNHLIQPFDETMEKSGIAVNISDYADILAQYSSLGYENMTFGIPIDARSEVVLYNKALLEKYGGELPSDNAGLLRICELAKQDGKMPISVEGASVFYADYFFTTALVQNDVRFYDRNSYKVDWYSNEDNRAAFTRAINAVRELNDKGYSKYGASSSQTLEAFLSDNTLFYVTLPWYLSDALAAYAKAHGGMGIDEVIDTKVGGTSIAGWFAKDPLSPSAHKIYGDSHFFAMSKTVTDITKKAAALEFVKWFTQTEGTAIRWGEAGHISAFKPVIASPAYWQNKYIGNYLRKFYPDINNFECSGVTPYYSDINKQISSLCANAIGNAALTGYDTLLQKAETDINGIVEFFS